MNKNLEEKAISIKGKKYILVADRIKFFNEEFKNGCIQTNLISQPTEQRVIVKAKVIPDIKNPDRYFTGYSQAVIGEGMVNKTAALENCETSAVGRALGMLGIGVLESVVSADEMVKAGTPIEEGETIPTCSICDKPMRKAKSGKWYCRHEENGKVSWGDAVFAPKQTDKEKAFSASLDEEDVVVVE